MAADDRKQRILQHLKQSTDGTHYISPKKTTKPIVPPTPPPTPTPPTPVSQPTPKPPLGDERKRRIMTHVKSSSVNFGEFSLKDEAKKKKIEDHIRKSLS